VAICISCGVSYALRELEECDNCGELVCDECDIETDSQLLCSNECERET